LEDLGALGMMILKCILETSDFRGCKVSTWLSIRINVWLFRTL
jgi:hypothetical protein